MRSNWVANPVAGSTPNDYARQFRRSSFIVFVSLFTSRARIKNQVETFSRLLLRKNVASRNYEWAVSVFWAKQPLNGLHVSRVKPKQRRLYDILNRASDGAEITLARSLRRKSSESTKRQRSLVTLQPLSRRANTTEMKRFETRHTKHDRFSTFNRLWWHHVCFVSRGFVYTKRSARTESIEWSHCLSTSRRLIKLRQLRKISARNQMNN